MNIAILGGGISGITLQRFLTNHDSTIIEASLSAGGLCRTLDVDGFKFDVGGHIFSSRHQHVTDFVSSLVDCHTRSMDTKKIFYDGHLIDYPFYKSLWRIPSREEIFKCVNDYLERTSWETPLNAREWFIIRYGRAIAEKNLIQYTAKAWKTDPSEMSTDWLSRIPETDEETIIRSALGLPLYIAPKSFLYPKNGGYLAIAYKIADHDRQKISVNDEVRKLEWDKASCKWAVVSGNSKRHFDRIVSTIPLPELSKACSEFIPDDVTSAINNLKYISISVAMFGYKYRNFHIENSGSTETEAVYVADPRFCFHRLCFPRFFSESMVPKGCWSVAAEVTHDPGEIPRIQNILTDFHRFINELGQVPSEPNCERIVTFKYGYPVHTIDRRECVEKARTYFNSIGIDLLGRFGEFEYINSDECIHRAMMMAERLNAT